MSHDISLSECQDPSCQAAAIYQCPRCQFRSCSLRCCQAHKQSSKCNGKRDRTQFLPMNQMSDATLTSDYFFLEDVMRQVKKPRFAPAMHNKTEPATHPLLQQVDHMDRFQRLPQHYPQKVRKLVQAAGSRGTRIMIQPSGLSRHQENRSYLNKEGIIHWSVEIITIMEDSDGSHCCEKKERILAGPLAETSRVGDVVPITIPTGFACYLRRFPSVVHQPVNIDSTWKEALQDMTIIEFPTLYIGPKSTFSQAITEMES
ncbi:hypothetical protein FisN_27Lu121 [Fistulifera solaris]|uniref:HIT-type domain-containing protein n=1 Tax=Fistulifera solaris TaxID=1519565 RepID=A0A1Z5JQT7_FISSO|nr:hypothetical protein FisN_27Lu121 [Fistulifera solaris]|eukprot:GAX16373.1 hypothetical protein FisN_27Lu121 [Fistulifera solaris]